MIVKLIWLQCERKKEKHFFSSLNSTLVLRSDEKGACHSNLQLAKEVPNVAYDQLYRERQIILLKYLC